MDTTNWNTSALSFVLGNHPALYAAMKALATSLIPKSIGNHIQLLEVTSLVYNGTVGKSNWTALYSGYQGQVTRDFTLQYQGAQTFEILWSDEL